MLTQDQVQTFKEQGFVVLPAVADADTVRAMREQTFAQLAAREEPLELEAAVKYPGAPKSLDAEGGMTARRLLMAYDRGSVFKDWAHNKFITQNIQQLLGSKELWLTPNHHNTVMTKHPKYSSDTLWHRDTRYWHYTDNSLVNAWTALGAEYPQNGGMKVIPGSHLWHVDDQGLDDLQFLKLDYEGNQAQLEKAVYVELSAGDVLLFSPYIFHAADRCKTDEIKCSLVFTYHGENTVPVGNTKSAHLPEIRII
ncbi:MAG: phytanoyl-CoA dioxygenase [Proteobacteria bacterium]|nr:MAG: phytanoyl-CoA dioxygenase [Pseudomonadota bacterium]